MDFFNKKKFFRKNSNVCLIHLMVVKLLTDIVFWLEDLKYFLSISYESTWRLIRSFLAWQDWYLHTRHRKHKMIGHLSQPDSDGLLFYVAICGGSHCPQLFLFSLTEECINCLVINHTLLGFKKVKAFKLYLSVQSVPVTSLVTEFYKFVSALLMPLNSNIR